MRTKVEKTNSIFYMMQLVVFIGIATFVGSLFTKLGFPETNVVIIYILSVLLTARLTYGYFYGILSSVLATFAFNYFFTKPYYTFNVEDPSYLITFVIMTVTAILTSALTTRVKQNAMFAAEKEFESRALYQLTNQLTDAVNEQEIASISTGFISEVIGCRAACLCFDEEGNPEHSFIQQIEIGKQIHRDVINPKELKARMEYLKEPFDATIEFYDWPLYGQECILGVIRIPSERAMHLEESQANLLRTMIESTALAMDRFRQIQQRIKSNEAMLQERYRGDLLRAISHDLRTPLTGIIGTSEMLMDMTEKEDARYELERAIYQDAEWLRSLVENILNLTKLQEGRLILHKEYEVVEEIVGSAVGHVQKRWPNYNIEVSIPEEVLMIPMDAKLIEQVLINLLDNAIKHNQEEKNVQILVFDEKEQEIQIAVRDQGCGIAREDMPKLFQMFYTSASRGVDSRHGMGLGLTICEAIVKAHGGSIAVSNRRDRRGAQFLVSLPRKE